MVSRDDETGSLELRMLGNLAQRSSEVVVSSLPGEPDWGRGKNNSKRGPYHRFASPLCTEARGVRYHDDEDYGDHGVFRGNSE